MDKGQFDWWKEAMAGKNPEFIDGEFHSGYYRKKVRKDSKEWGGVGIFKQESGEYVCLQVSKSFGETTTTESEEIAEIFKFSCKNPIKHQLFEEFRKTHVWPDDAGLENESLEKEGGTSSKQQTLHDKEGLFDGLDIDGIPIESLEKIQAQALSNRDQFATILGEAKKYEEIEPEWIKASLNYVKAKIKANECLSKEVETDEEADSVAHVKSWMETQKKEITTIQKGFSGFYYNMHKRITAMFGDLAGATDSKVKELRLHVDVFLRKKRAEDERKKREAQEAIDEANKKRQEEERIAAKLQADIKRLKENGVKLNDPDSIAEVEKQIAKLNADLAEAQKKSDDANKAVASNTKVVENKSKTSIGSTSSKIILKKVKKASITDRKAAMDYLCANDDEFNQKVTDYIIAKAKRDGKFPGVDVWEDEVAQ